MTTSSSSPLTASATAFSFSLNNVGQAGAPFVLFDLLNLAKVRPRNYAVEAGKSITDSVNVTMLSSSVSSLFSSSSSPPLSSDYAFILMGPNGFVREFAGETNASHTSPS